MTTLLPYLADPSKGLVAEVRPAQVALMAFLSEALEYRTPVLIEAGTGIGKSFTYLLAAIEEAKRGRRVALSTAMKSLQQQLFFKDLPYLKTIFGDEMPRYARHLGKKNYGCKRKVSLAVFGPEEEVYDTFFETTKHWVWEDATVPVPEDAWKYSVGYCSKDRCDFFEECSVNGYLAAREATATAQIVVVNHALVGADIRVDAQHDVKIFGDYQTLVVDEAHKYPEAIRNALTYQMPAAFFEKASRAYQEHLRNVQSDMVNLALACPPPQLPATLPSITELQRKYVAMFRETQRTDSYGPAALDFATATRPGCIELLDAFGVGNKTFGPWADGADLTREWAPPAAVRNGWRESSTIMSTLLFLHEYVTTLFEYAGAIDLATTDRLKYVVTVVQDAKGVSELHTIPIDIGERLQTFYTKREILPAYMSATLAVNGKFGHYAQEVGHDLVEGSTFLAASPFDYAKQAWCYAPAHIPEPTSAQYMPAVIGETYDLLMANEGHAFILFTSYKDLEAVAAGLRERGYPYPLLTQNAQLKAKGREIFLNTPNATLLGTRTFWEGIDIPGLALTLVIIPKAPFPNPSDPVIKAKSAIAGDKWFNEVSMPAALVDLRQMSGRLIRSTKDRGVVALLDSRVHTKRYGKQLVAAVGFPWNAKKEIPLKLLGQLAERRKKECP